MFTPFHFGIKQRMVYRSLVGWGWTIIPAFLTCKSTMDTRTFDDSLLLLLFRLYFLVHYYPYSRTHAI
jgi:hypothetical protein